MTVLEVVGLDRIRKNGTGVVYRGVRGGGEENQLTVVEVTEFQVT